MFDRRPDFSPDGTYLVCPSGVYRPPPGATELSQSFCCHIFARNQLNYPIASIVGLEDSAVAIRFSPVVFKKLDVPFSSPTTSGHGQTTDADVPATGLKENKMSYLQGTLRYYILSNG